MGILIVPDFASCTHLASPRIVRTQKFICALAHAPVILSTSFVDDCLSESKLLEPENYLLQDSEGEQRLGHKLEDSIARAKSNKGRLLQEYSIYCTDYVHGGFDTYKSIVEVNGGKCLLYRARASSNVGLRAGPEEESDDPKSAFPEYAYLISGTSHEDAKLWPKFRQMAEAMGKKALVVRTDWVLNLALSQEHRWSEVYALTDKNVGEPDP